MTDEEVIHEFIQVYKGADSVRFYVRRIDWEGPHTPTTTMVNVTSVEGELTEADIQSEIIRISNDPKYFMRCDECGELNPVGWMLPEMGICQECGTRNHDIVY